MTVSVTSAYSTGTGNGSATVFSFSFRCKSAAEVAVYEDGVLQNSGFTVVVNSNGIGGTVTFTVAPANGVAVLIASSPLFTQLISFENAGKFLPTSHDDANDRAAIRDIYLNACIERSILAPWGETLSFLPPAADRAGLYLKFDTNGDVTADSAAGAQGEQGIQGIQGIQGDQGDPGPAPTLTFGAVTTGAAGSSASVNTVDLGGGAYRLDFTIPRGNTGASGALSDGTYGDIVVSSSGTVLTVGNGAITLAKMAAQAGAGLLGATSATTPSVLSFATVKSQLSLNNVDNTSDANKPVSTAQQTALNAKADLNSPTFTGDPKAPTASERDADTSLATTAFVDRLYDIDQSAKSAAYTLALSDRGSTVSTNSTVHVPANATVAFPIGAFVEIYNASNSSITVDFSSGTDVFRKHGSTSTVTTLTLAARSIGQLRKPDIATEWLAIGFA